MKKGLLIVVILVAIIVSGCGVKYRSCKEVPFERADIVILADTSTRGYLVFKNVFFKREKLEIGANIEKAKIEVEFRSDLNGILLSVKPRLIDAILGKMTGSDGYKNAIEASWVKIICGSQEDMKEWKERIKTAKKELSDLRTKPREVVAPKIS